MIFKIKFVPRKFLNLGITLAVIGFFVNLIEGYSILIPVLWILSIISVGFYFFIRSPKIKWSIQLEKADIIYPIALVIIFAPLYLLFLYQIPYQINTDEILLTGLTESRSITPTLLGLSNYVHIPSFIFVLYRFFLSFQGEINIENVRAFHATSGLIIIIVSYFFFKMFRSWQFAFAGAALLGSGHVFLAISRMALIHNPAVLIELLSLIFLISGLKKKSAFYSYLGGIIAGLSFYNHITSTIIIILWACLIAISALFYRDKFRLKTLIKHSLISLLGIIIVALPFFMSYLKLPLDSPSYYKKQLLIFPEGGQQLYGKNYLDIIESEAIKVITIFNNNLPDANNIYPNPGHGFVDPITGVLVWLGFAIILFKRRKNLEESLIISSFLLILAIFSFIVNKAPHYNRMQIVLPFTVFLSLEAIRAISNKLYMFRKYIFIGLVSTIFILNLSIYLDFINRGFTQGDVFGATIRYVEKRKNIPRHTFLIATNEKSRYFTWYDDWITPLQSKSQTVTVLDPNSLENKDISNLYKGNFTLFLNADIWEKAKMNLTNIYPNLVIHNMMPNGSKIAIEVK